jgi:hypothetical protein
MQDLIEIYDHNEGLIKKFLLSSLKQMNLYEEQKVEKLFATFPTLELIYETDESFIQNSSNYYRDRTDMERLGVDRSYLFDNEMDDIYFSQPYISTATRKLCITLVFKTKEGYIFLDFRVRKLLERFDLIVSKKGFNRINSFSYSFIGGGLIFFALFVVSYGFYEFVMKLFIQTDMSMDIVFKSVIALTLGLAIYDLGKTILEQEVLPKTQHSKSDVKIKTLLNFSTSILIALLIEALLVVFKISIHDYKDLPYAAVFVLALSFLLAVFAYISKVFKND